MLNRVFNVVFNYSLGVFTAVSELCRRRHKTKSISRSQSLFNAIRFNLSRLSLGVLIACGLISEPTWAAGVILKDDGKLYFCTGNPTNNATACDPTSSVIPLAAYVGVNSTGGSNISGGGAQGTDSIAIGKDANAVSNSDKNTGGSIAIGNSAQAGNNVNAAIAIGDNASANYASALAVGRQTKVTGSGGIAIGAAKSPNLAAQAGQDSLSLGYNTHTDQAFHSIAIGSNLRVKGQENIVMGSGVSGLLDNNSESGGAIYGYGNTVIGANNILTGKYRTETIVNGTAINYVDIANNMIFGSGNKIIGTAADETKNTMNDTSNPSTDSWNSPYGAYKNLILGTGNTLNKNNYKNVILATNAILNAGANNNTLIGSGITVNSNVSGSYVLGNDVAVTANNSVYFGDGAVASLRPTLSTVAAGTAESSPQPTTLASLDSLSKEDRARVERYGITAGELGQTSATIAGIRYNFAGLGSANGGVVTVGKLVYKPAQGSAGTTAYVPAHYETVGRIIQNVAPGLIGQSSTDAINGSQLYAVMTAVNNAIGKVTSGESGPVVYTTADGKRVYKENGVFYDPAVTTVTEGSNIVTYQQASNNLWFDILPCLKAGDSY